MLSILMRSLLLLLIPVIALSQTPGVRNAHSMIYHEKEGAVYLFGGASESEVKNDLWKWKQDKWIKVEATGPVPRTFASMIYDSSKDRIVLFGGSKVLFGSGPNPNNLLNDTWIFRDGSWSEIFSSEVPSKRAESAMAFDPDRKRIVLFGGYEIRAKSYAPTGDTWEYDGSTWNLINQEGPSKRNGAAISYDKSRNVIVLFGGSTGRNGYGSGKGETWFLENHEWTKLDILQPTNIFNASMVNSKDGTIRFGGWNGERRINETWILEVNQWTMLNPKQSPPARNHTAMVYDSQNDQIILYGGHDGTNVFGDLWKYNSGQWEKLAKVPSKPRIPNGH